METFLVVFFIIAILILFSLGIWFAIIWYTKEEEDVMKGAFCLNLMSHYSNNFAYGIEKSVKTGVGGRQHITYSPLDIDVKKVGKIEDQKVIVGKGKRIILPVGDLSMEKNITILLPPNSDDFPQTIKNSELGKVLMLKTEEINSIVKEAELYLNRIGVLEDVSKETLGAEIVRKYITLDSELNKDRAKKLLTEKEEKKPFPGGYIPPTSPM